MFFDVKAELPKTHFQGAKFVKLVQDAIAETVAEDARGLVDKTVATWTHKPDISVEVTARGSRVRVGNVQVGSRRKPIWKYLDEGTAKRYAVMTKGFAAKTRPGYLVSYAGRGRLAYISDKPRPGIKARGWSYKINERMTPIIQKSIRKAIQQGLLNVKGG